MNRKLILLIFVAFLVPGIVSAQSGKIRGKVTDRESGEELIGANVGIVGTTQGAATDIDGEYVVVNVAPGGYSLRASFVGYAPVTISNVVVNAGLTTTLDFQLPSTSVQTEPVVIVAQRPLVSRNTPNTIRITSRSDVENLPIRGTQTILALDAGVVQQNGVLYVRGGRAGELAYFVDGASVTNRLNNSEGVSVVQEAFQELQFQPGGYTAEFGGANSGIAKTTVRTGGNKISASADYRTDDFAKPGSGYLGGSSFGYRNAVVSVGGPVQALKMRYFFVGQHNYQRTPAQFLFPFRFDSLRTDINDVQPGRLLPGTVELMENFTGVNWNYTNTGQGTFLFNLDPVVLKLTGSYMFSKSPSSQNSWPSNLTNIFNLHRSRENETKVYFLNLRATHALNPETFYEAGISYYKRDFESFDPRFGSDFLSYPDSLANAPFGDTGNWTRRYRGPISFSATQGFTFTAPDAPNNAYSINSQRSIEGAIDFVSQITKKWEFKAGGRLEVWKMRQYVINSISGALEAVNGIFGTTPVTFPSEAARRVQWARQGRVNNYGYDVFGNEVEGDVLSPDSPRKPVFASAYFQNKIEYRDLVINFGLRYEFFDPKTPTFSDAVNYVSTDYNPSLDIIDESKLVEGTSFSYVLPRLNFSFPVSDRTVFYAQYGKFVQMPSLSNIFLGTIALSTSVSPTSRGNAFLTPVGYLSTPERLTQYEMGFRQAITDFAALTISGFYKDTRDQLAVRKFTDASGNATFTAWLNKDFGTVKGLEFVLDLRRTERLAARINYTLSDARGTGSNPSSSFSVVERQDIGRFPDFINPLDFNQAHRGSITLDYRFAKGDGGPVLEGLGANLLLTFNSGHPYTKIKEPESLGQANPYNIGVRPDQDPRLSIPVEAVNESTTPTVFNIDIFTGKTFYLENLTLTLYVNALNVLNSKNVNNVYRNTGAAEDDGWLTSALAAEFRKDPEYVALYKAFNLDNRWAYTLVNGVDIYGQPRQVRFGVRLEY